MRALIISTGICCILTSFAFAEEVKAPEAESKSEEVKAPESQSEKLSYSIGARIGSGLKRDGVELDPGQMLAGIKDSFEGKSLQLTEEQMQMVMQAFQQEMQKKMQVAAVAAGAKNMTEGKSFLEENGKKEGVVTTSTGLQYQVLTSGEGPKPTPNDKIKAHYHGTLIDGTVFDSSVQRGEPVSFPVSGVIPGWTEALQLMPVGSKWKLYIPSALAYGERGAGPVIGPNSTLIFEVELLEIEQ